MKVNVQLHTPAALIQGKWSPKKPSSMKLGGPNTCLDAMVKTKNLICRESNPGILIGTP
jgi:hypothetical protein